MMPLVFVNYREPKIEGKGYVSGFLDIDFAKTFNIEKIQDLFVIVADYSNMLEDAYSHLGYYNTKEEAIDALNKLFDAIENNKKSFKMP